MTTNGRPEPREGSVPGRTGDAAGKDPAGPQEPPGGLDAGTAERLLDGDPGVPLDDPRVADLARLLSRAAREADSLAGNARDERLVLTAFREARAGRARAGRAPAGGSQAVPGRRGARWRRASRPTRALAGGVAAVLLLGGVAIAEQTGALPHPFRSGNGTPAQTRSPHPSASSHGAPGTPGAGRTTAPPDPATPSAPATPAPRPSVHGPGTPAPTSLAGLCASYTHASRRGGQLDSTARRRLEAAAGGPAEIAAYCARLTGIPASGRGGTAASPPAAPAVPAAPAATAPRVRPSHAPRPAPPAGVTGPAKGRGRA
jgi:hypothetical protein